MIVKGTDYCDKHKRKIDLDHACVDCVKDCTNESKKLHDWELDENGEVNIWAVDAGFHNGPRCVRCYAEFCHSCDPECYEDECEG